MGLRPKWRATAGLATTGAGSGGGVGYWSTDRTAVEVKNVYIDFGLPYFGIPVPITVRVGAQPIGLRPHILVYTDGMGVTATAKVDPVMLSFIYAKPVEGLNWSSDDSDVYGLHLNAKLGTVTLGAYGLWYNMNTYPFWVASALTGFPANLFSVVQGTNKANMYWLGAYLDGKLGPVNLNYDFVYDFGQVSRKLVGADPNYAPDVKYQGWAQRLKIDFPWEKFNFGVVGMYATGSDARETSVSGLPGTTVAWGTGGPPAAGGWYGNWQSRRVSGYVVPPGSEQGPVNSESLVVYGMEAGATGGAGISENANYNALSKGAFGGTWFAKLYASAKLTPWYKLTFQTLYIGDTTAHGDTLGSAVKYPGTPLPYLKDSNTIGWEFNLINEIWLYNNLRFMFGYGYLMSGGALDVSRNINPVVGGVPVYTNVSPQNPWAFRTRLIYTF